MLTPDPRTRISQRRLHPEVPLGPEPVRPDGSVIVRLSNSPEVALVSVEDFPRVMAYAWRRNTSGYAFARPRKCVRGHWRQVTLPMHRLIARAPAALFVDHRNGHRLDNRRSNLRRATNSQNQANRHQLLPLSRKSSRYRGVTWHKGCRRWQAAIKCQGVNHHLGVHAREEDAAKAYNRGARRYFGRFALLNVILPAGETDTARAA